MDVLIVLIPFLIMSASFIHLALVDTFMPAITTEEQTTSATQKQKLLIYLMIKQNKLSLDATLADGKKAIQPVSFGKLYNGRHNFKKLTLELEKLKDKYPWERSIILVPEPNTEYQTIIRAIDASREKIIRDEHGNILKRKKLFTVPALSGGGLTGGA